MTGGKYVLIIDDSELVRNVLSDLLIGAGYVVGLAETAEAGFQMVKRKRPDALILDLDLPDVSGQQFCALLKNDPELRHLPILICTGHGASDEKISGLRLGADDYVTKPFAGGEFLERVNAIFRRQEQARERAEQDLLARTSRPAAQTSISPEEASVPMDSGESASGAGRLMAAAGRALAAAWLHLANPRESAGELAGLAVVAALGPVWLLAFIEGLCVYSSTGRFGLGVVCALAVSAAWAAGIVGLRKFAGVPEWTDLTGAARWSAAMASPLALAGALAWLYVLVTGGAASDFSGSPLLLAGRVAPNSWAGVVLARADLFDLWAAYLLWRLARAQVSPRRALATGVGGWLFATALRWGVGLLF